ncbi:MAG: hypothetical protein K0Q70_2172 [Rhodospirillales bacterium]|nr:hypothetical protein [Rhodospirillales bacterium]
MQGFYDTHVRDTEIDMSGQDTDGCYSMDRRSHPDRRKKDRRASKASGKSSSAGSWQPILTQAEIAALLRGAR